MWCEPCKSCLGKCCRSGFVIPVVPTDEIYGNKKYINCYFDFDQGREANTMKSTGDGYTCIALDEITGKCTIWGKRPQACKDFAAGGKRCNTIRQEIKNMEINENEVITGAIVCNDILCSDPDGIYCIYFKDNWNSANATIVNDANGTPIKGKVGGRRHIPFTFNYGLNDQNGRTPGTDVEVIIIGMGLKLAKYERTYGVITKNGPNQFAINTLPEKNEEDEETVDELSKTGE